jgi:uncharacterized protein YceH (UPF0502 family)
MGNMIEVAVKRWSLTPLEVRVLGVLVEKQHTVPDTYPLSLNAIVAGCNQKTARLPVMEATEAEVLTAIDSLRAQSLIFESSGARVARYEHNAGRVLHLPSQAVAPLAVLMLRGPQTTAELRVNTERMQRFADLSSLEAFLNELADKAPPLVIRLPRAPGSREARWAHLLGGPVETSPVSADSDLGQNGGADRGMAIQGVAAGELAALRAEQIRIAAEIANLKSQMARLFAELGIDPGSAEGGGD